MSHSLIKYECVVCGHTWTWGYLFVVKCHACKSYQSFSQAAVCATELTLPELPTDHYSVAPHTSHINPATELVHALKKDDDAGNTLILWGGNGLQDGLPASG